MNEWRDDRKTEPHRELYKAGKRMSGVMLWTGSRQLESNERQDFSKQGFHKCQENMGQSRSQLSRQSESKN